METPKFLIADNSQFPEKIYILHTEFPRFLLDVETEEIDIYDDIEDEDVEEAKEELLKLVEAAFEFFDQEMDSYEE